MTKLYCIETWQNKWNHTKHLHHHMLIEYKCIDHEKSLSSHSPCYLYPPLSPSLGGSFLFFLAYTWYLTANPWGGLLLTASTCSTYYWSILMTGFYIYLLRLFSNYVQNKKPLIISSRGLRTWLGESRLSMIFSVPI